jgi:hypothetical protein
MYWYRLQIEWDYKKEKKYRKRPWHPKLQILRRRQHCALHTNRSHIWMPCNFIITTSAVSCWGLNLADPFIISSGVRAFPSPPPPQIEFSLQLFLSLQSMRYYGSVQLPDTAVRNTWSRHVCAFCRWYSFWIPFTVEQTQFLLPEDLKYQGLNCRISKLLLLTWF